MNKFEDLINEVERLRETVKRVKGLLDYWRRCEELSTGIRRDFYGDLADELRDALEHG